MKLTEFLDNLSDDFKITILTPAKAKVVKDGKALIISDDNLPSLDEMNNDFKNLVERLQHMNTQNPYYDSNDFYMGEKHFRNKNNDDDTIDLSAPLYAKYDKIYPGDRKGARNKKRDPFPDHQRKPKYDDDFGI